MVSSDDTAPARTAHWGPMPRTVAPIHDEAVADAAWADAGGDDGVSATVVLAQVRWLLQDAAEEVRVRAQAEGLLSSGHPFALGVELAACETANLIPGVTSTDWYGPERIPGEALECLLAAEALTCTLPIDAFPAGMSQLVIRICELIREATALPDPSSTTAADSTGTPRAAGPTT